MWQLIRFLHVQQTLKIQVQRSFKIFPASSHPLYLPLSQTHTRLRWSRSQRPVIDLTNVLWSSTLTIYTHLVSCGNLQAFPFTLRPCINHRWSLRWPSFLIKKRNKQEKRWKWLSSVWASYSIIITGNDVMRMKPLKVGLAEGRRSYMMSLCRFCWIWW